MNSSFLKCNLPVLYMLCFPLSAFCQSYPAKAKIPVTFYDHCSRESTQEGNWNFNPEKHPYGKKSGLVKNRLGPNKKPEFKADIAQNSELNSWYLPNPGASDCKNRVIAVKDTLVFTHTENGFYRFKDETFYPLTGKGLNAPGGPEKRLASRRSGLQNFGFTMELSGSFTYKESDMKNKVMTFASDDDFFLFVNGELIVELGGIHMAKHANVSMPFKSIVDKLGLADGRECTIHIFYAERHIYMAELDIEIPLLNTAIIPSNSFTYKILKIR